ncbi:hypothetical protein XHV734_0102 [Xanthomonas hortorum pv. vitians]|nr:hypothetical protein XHV734_0102 [Xanthomonas hortorum pv. vitians]
MEIIFNYRCVFEAWKPVRHSILVYECLRFALTLGLPVLCEFFGLLRALARVPAWDTPQVRPCRLLRGIHAA